MKNRIYLLLIVAAILSLLSVSIASCGGRKNLVQPENSDSISVPAGNNNGNQPFIGQNSGGGNSQNQFPSSLPNDGVQPWEKLDANGFVIRDRESGIGDGKSASSINLDTDFTPGVERFSEMGDVTGFSEASRFASGAAGAKGVSYALYRIVLGGAQPGAVSADVNLLTKQGGGISRYYLGLSDYGNGTWKWFGPFSDSHVRLSIPGGDFTSGVGNTFVAVVAYDGARFDVVGIGVNAKDAGDTAAPPVPSAPVLTSVEGGVVAEWIPVVASDIAGYRVYSSPVDFSTPDSAGAKALPYLEGGTRIVIPAKTETFVRIAAVDVSGNESPLSTASSAAPQTGTAIAVSLETDIVSGRRGDVASLTATGAELYDFDLDGDGVFEITGQASGAAIAPMNAPGIIRPAVRGTTAGGGVAYAAVSLIISVNSRPVASATANPSSGIAPLMVNFTGTGEDNDGTVTEYAWDFDGDGVFDSTDQNPSNNYAASGLFNAKLRVTDNDGDWSVDTVGIFVQPASPPDNVPPIADLLPNVAEGEAPLAVNFSASGSSDPDGDIVQYLWDFDGDGGYERLTFGPTTSYTYTAVGEFDARLAVVDNDGATGTATFTISVNVPFNALPNVMLNANPMDGDFPLTVNFDATESIDDGEIVRFDWDFDGDGNYEIYDGGATASWTYNSPGVFEAKARATDNFGAQGTDFKTINVSVPGNESPTADLSPSTASGDAPFTVDFDASGSGDTDGSIVNYEWDFNGDGIYDGYGMETGAEYTYANSGTYTAKLRVTDDKGAQSVDTATITVNAIPVAALSATPPNCEKGETVRFEAAASYDPDGNIINYEWDLDGDGNYGESPSESGAAGNTAVEVVFPDSGRFFVSVRVTDDASPAATDIATVDVYVHGWVVASPSPDSAGDVGTHTTMEMVNGFPAISYYDGTNQLLKYVRATDSEGSAWGVPVSVDNGGAMVGKYSSLAVVNGKPAISYWDETNGDLKFVRSLDANGNSWDDPIILDSTGDVGQDTSLSIINGNPAISYHDATNGDLLYVRATNVDGSTWGTPFVIDGTNFVGWFSSLALVNGNPAISYSNATNADLMFVRASDANGTSWNSPVIVDSPGFVGYYTSLEVVDGHPAISYFQDSTYALKYVRATDVNGAGWNAPLILDSGSLLGSYTSLAIVDGFPAISYFDVNNFDVKYIRATNSEGSAWATPITAESNGLVGSYTSLLEIDGLPAISFYDISNGDLGFVRLY